MADFNILWERVAVEEGGYQNGSKDVGNYCNGQLIGTKYGVSAVNYKEYYGVCPTVAQMRNLTKPEGKAIWKKTVWDKIKGDQIKSLGAADLILDAAGGGKTGYLNTRQAINKAAGKKLVTETSTMTFTNAEIAALNSLPEETFLDAFYSVRLGFFKNNSQYAIYGAGWIRRLDESYKLAKSSMTAFAKKNPKTSILIAVGIIAISIYGFIYLRKVLK